jgi:hypothetical protein
MRTDHEELQGADRGRSETARGVAGGGEEEDQEAKRGKEKELPQLAGTFHSPREFIREKRKR